MKYCQEFHLDGLPKTINALGRAHWAIKSAEARKWIRLMGDAIGIDGPDKPLSKAKLTLTRVSSKAPDSDGLVSSFKHVIDGLVRAGVLVDDKFENIGMPDYRWLQCPMKQGKIVVKVEEI